MKILIVENNAVAADVLFFMLRGSFDIRAVRDNLAALRELQKDKFDIFLIGSNRLFDFKNDVEFIRYVYIQKLNPQMKIVVMSEDRNKKTWSVFFGVGAETVVEKTPILNVVEAVKKIAARIEISV